MRDITRSEVKDAVDQFLANGGKIAKIKFQDNGFLLNNDLLMDQNHHSELKVLNELQIENITETEVVN